MTRRLTAGSLALVATFVLGCGGGGSNTPDGGARPPDAAPTPDSTPTPDAAPKPVTVTVYQFNGAGTLFAGAPVIFHNPDGTVMTETSTNDSGQVSAVVAPGSAVTVVYDANLQLVTITDVQPGDNLTVGNPVAPTETVAKGTMNVMFPGTATGALSYQVLFGCGGANTGDPTSLLGVTLDTTCGDKITFLATASDDGGNPVAFTFLVDVPFAADGTVTLPAWRTDLTSEKFIAHNNVGSLSLNLHATTWADGLEYLNSSRSQPLTSSLSLDYAAGYASAYQTGLDEQLSGQRLVIRQEATPPTSEAFDLLTDFLPRVDHPVLDGQSLSWALSAPLQGDDGSWLDLTFVNQGMDGTWDWTFAVPPGASSLIVPALPTDWAKYEVGALTSLNFGNVWIMGADFLEPKDFREQAGTATVPNQVSRLANNLLPAPGELRISTSQSGD